MIRMLLICLISFLVQYATAQQTKMLTYEYTDINDYSTESYLFINNTESLFIIKDPRMEVNNTTPTGLIYKLYNDKWSRIFYKSKTQNLTRIPIYGKELVYESKGLASGVNLTGKEKKIGNYQCQQALIKKGGRQYSIWFTDDTGLVASPLNLAEVPGLVVQITDTDEKHFSVTLKKVSNSADMDLFESYKKYILAKKPLTYPDYEKKTIELISNVKRENFAILAKYGAKLEMSANQSYYTVHLVDIPKNLVSTLQKITQ